MKARLLAAACASVLVLPLVGCGGGGSSPPPPPPNVAPTASLTASEAGVRETDVFTLDAGGSADANGDALVYSFTQTAGPSASVSASGATAEVTAPRVDADATLTFQVTVSDGRGGTDTASVDVDVSDNAPPVAALERVDPFDPLETTSIDLLATQSSDPENDPLSYSYRIVSGPDIDLSAETGPSVRIPVPRVEASTSVTVELTVDDGRDQSTDTLDFTIIDNIPPTLSDIVVPAGITEGQEVVVLFEASDAPQGPDVEFDCPSVSATQIAGPDAAFELQNVCGDFALVFTAPEVVADSVVSFNLVADDDIDTTTERVDVMVGNLVLGPDAGFAPELTATLRTESRIAALVDGSNSEGLVFARDNTGVGTLDAKTTRLTTDSSAFLPLIDVEAVVASGLGGVRDIVTIGPFTNTIAIIAAQGVRFAEFDIRRSGDVLDPPDAYTELGTLDIENACAVAIDTNERSFGQSLFVGRTDGISVYGFSAPAMERGIDVGSLELLDSLDDGNNYCALSRPRSGNGPTSAVLAFDTEALAASRTVLVDEGAGVGRLDPGFRTDSFAGLPPADYAFVDAARPDNAVSQLSAVISDDQREGNHAILDMRLPLNNSDAIETEVLAWTTGRPGSVNVAGYAQFEGNTQFSNRFIFVTLPGTPFLLTAPFNSFETTNRREFVASYAEVGIGLDGIEATTFNDGDFSRTNADPALVLFDSDAGIIRRFGVSPPPRPFTAP